MVASAALTLLQPRTGCGRGLVQPLSWVQYGLSLAARNAHRSIHALGHNSLSGEEAEALRVRYEELRRQLAHEQLMSAELKRQLADASGLREQFGDSGAKILIAPVLAYDSSPRRETLLIGMGAARDVRVGQWVAAGAPRDPRDPALGRELLARQWLIGQISEVWPNTSRVQLATDPQFKRVLVYPAKTLDDGKWEPMGPGCLLSGCGGGRMVIDRASEDYYAAGCRIVVVPSSAWLPASLTIGEIRSSEAIAEAPLHYNLEVRPWADARALTHVYVMVPGALP